MALCVVEMYPFVFEGGHCLNARALYLTQKLVLKENHSVVLPEEQCYANLYIFEYKKVKSGDVGLSSPLLHKPTQPKRATSISSIVYACSIVTP